MTPSLAPPSSATSVGFIMTPQLLFIYSSFLSIAIEDNQLDCKDLQPLVDTSAAIIGLYKEKQPSLSPQHLCGCGWVCFAPAALYRLAFWIHLPLGDSVHQ